MEKIIRANTCVLTWGTGFLTSSRLDFFITVGSQDVLPARTDPKPEYVAPAGLRGKRGLTEHVHGCLHCPPPDLPTACIMLAAKKCEKLSVFCHPAIASCNIYCMAQSTQIRPAGHGRRTVKKTCHTWCNGATPFSQSGASDLITSLGKKNTTKNTGKTPQKTVT